MNNDEYYDIARDIDVLTYQVLRSMTFRSVSIRSHLNNLSLSIKL